MQGISHITGGGFYENIPRSLPEGFGVKIDRSALRILPIFDLIAKTGNIPERDMFNTFNMGVGMSVVVAKEDAEKALQILNANGEDAYVIGEIVSITGETVVVSTSRDQTKIRFRKSAIKIVDVHANEKP